MGNAFIKKNNDINFHHLEIKSLIERCNLLELMKTLLFVARMSGNNTIDSNKLLKTMINCALGRFKRMQDCDTVELIMMIINEQCRLNHPEKAMEYLTLAIEHIRGDMYHKLIQECIKRHNYFMYQLGQSEELSDYGDLHVSELSYGSVCKYIRLGHYIHKFEYRDNNPITDLLHTAFCAYTSLHMPLFKYFPDMRSILYHDTRVLEEMYNIFVPYDNAGNINVILSLYDSNPDDMLINIPLKFGLYVQANGKIRYINE